MGKVLFLLAPRLDSVHTFVVTVSSMNFTFTVFIGYLKKWMSNQFSIFLKKYIKTYADSRHTYAIYEHACIEPFVFYILIQTILSIFCRSTSKWNFSKLSWCKWCTASFQLVEPCTLVWGLQTTDTVHALLATSRFDLLHREILWFVYGPFKYQILPEVWPLKNN